MDATACSTLFAWIDREVWLVTAAAGNRRGGLIATFVSEASIVPAMPRMLVGIARQHHTGELIRASGVLTLHLLSEANVELVWRFGLQSGRDRDKFEGLEVEQSPSGCPVLHETIGWLECRVETSLDIGDRTLYLAGVVEGKVSHFAPPLTSKRLMELAPPHLLAEMKRQRHLDSYRDAECIRQWREEHGVAM
jgi:flavin reductase (DIM6/NTAB) family NADH-FMN oxidoreductase RutF